MPEQTPACDLSGIREAVCIHTKKVTDACRDKDCIEDLRVYLTRESQSILDRCATARARCIELIHTDIQVEAVPYNTGFYTLDITFFYRVMADATVGSNRPTTIYGLAVFSKRAVLCGEDSRAHIFRSDTRLGEYDGLTRSYANRPIAVVEVLDPMILASKIKDPSDCGCESVPLQIPVDISSRFDEELVLTGGQRRLFVTLGQFSIVRLERDAQLVVPVLDYSIPTKECCDNPGGFSEDPCEMFSRIPFPAQQFSPRNCDPDQKDCKTC